MPPHTPSGRSGLGLALALVTAGLWATLPVALEVALEQVDPLTLTWTRFAFAALVVGGWLAVRGELRTFRALDRRGFGLLALAAVMLIGNYVFYLVGLHHTSPGNAQLLIQAAPLSMAIGAILVFRERYNLAQWLGLLGILAGLAVFFADQLGKPMPPGSRYLLGSSFVLAGALSWAVYALAQKQLLGRLSSWAILGFIYAAAALLLLPAADPARLLALDGLHLGAVAYCALNTLAAYGAFAEALAHWEASRVSVVLSVTPLLTVAAVEGTHALAPTLVRPERLALAGWLGAALVVAGSAVSSLMGRRRA